MRYNLHPDFLRYGFYIILHSTKILRRKILTNETIPERPSGKYLSLEILKTTAQTLGIEVEHLGSEASEFKYRKIIRRIRSNMANDQDSAFGFWASGHKHLTFELLKKYGIKELPHNKLYSLSTTKEARRDFLARNKISVVKPCYGASSGKGITVGVKNIRQLNRAIFNALLYDTHYLIEDFVEGDHFRLLFYRDNFLGGLKRIPANVKGDGINTVRNLIKLANTRRSNDKSDISLYPIVIDNELRQTLANNNMSFDYIPTEDETVYVKTIANFNAGGEVEEMSDIVNSDLIEKCSKIPKIMDISLAGVDIITKDITKPLAETGGVINEVNTSPSLEIHYKVRNQEQRTDVAREILKRMFRIK